MSNTRGVGCLSLAAAGLSITTLTMFDYFSEQSDEFLSWMLLFLPAMVVGFATMLGPLTFALGVSTFPQNAVTRYSLLGVAGIVTIASAVWMGSNSCGDCDDHWSTFSMGALLLWVIAGLIHLTLAKEDAND